MAWFDPPSTTAPEGYDQKLWESIPSVRRQLYPGKHEILVFGQQSADGMHCLGCSWQTSYVCDTGEAVIEHDYDRGIDHDHDEWVKDRRGECPCGEEEN